MYRYHQETLDGEFVDFINRQLGNLTGGIKDIFKGAGKKIVESQTNGAILETALYEEKRRNQRMMMWGGAAIGTIALIAIARK